MNICDVQGNKCAPCARGQAVAGLDKAVGGRVGLDAAGHSAARLVGALRDRRHRGAIDARLRVFDAGRVLMTREGS